MTWVRVDEEFSHHPKVLNAGPLGMAMQIAALCYCNKYLTDGFIPERVVPTLLDLRGLGMRMWTGDLIGGGEDAEWGLVVEDLLSAGLWMEVPNGYVIHDFHDYQPSKDEVLELREKRKEAGRRGGLAKGQANAQGFAKQSSSKSSSKIEAKSKPDPVPVTDPETVTKTETDPKGKTLAPKSAREPDHLFEAVAESCGMDWRNGITKQARGSLNAAVKDLRDIGADPEAVRERAANWPGLFPDATLTPPALAKHWPQLARARTRGPRDRFAEMAQSLAQREEERNGQPADATDPARRGLSPG